jgi:hypothetical protein
LIFSLAPSAPPDNFTAIPSSPTSASITWDPPPTDDINGVIIRYIINVTVVGSGQTFLLNSTTTALTVTTLSPFSTYICIIAAVTSVGVGPFSSQVTLTTPQARKNSDSSEDCVTYNCANTCSSSFKSSTECPTLSHQFYLHQPYMVTSTFWWHQWTHNSVSHCHHWDCNRKSVQLNVHHNFIHSCRAPSLLCVPVHHQRIHSRKWTLLPSFKH